MTPTVIKRTTKPQFLDTTVAVVPPSCQLRARADISSRLAHADSELIHGASGLAESGLFEGWAGFTAVAARANTIADPEEDDEVSPAEVVTQSSRTTPEVPPSSVIMPVATIEALVCRTKASIHWSTTSREWAP